MWTAAHQTTGSLSYLCTEYECRPLSVFSMENEPARGPRLKLVSVFSTVGHMEHECLINQIQKQNTCSDTLFLPFICIVPPRLLLAAVSRIWLDIIGFYSIHASKYTCLHCYTWPLFSDILLSCYAYSVFSLCHFSYQL